MPLDRQAPEVAPPLLSPAAAWDRLAPHLISLPPQPIELRLALGRALAVDLTARLEIPPWDMAAMDGYAVAADVRPGARLPVAGSLAAGDPPGATLQPDTAVKIMTGAPVPEGSRRVVPVELTDGGSVIVTITRDAGGKLNIRRRAEVIERGEPLLGRGAYLSPEAISLLASQGLETVEAHQLPRVAVLTTGNEVIPPGAKPAPGQIFDSHTDFLLAACRRLGLEATPLGIARDEPTDLERLLRSGLTADVFVVCGGVSKGDFDLVPQALSEAGCEEIFRGIAVQPGKPLMALRHPQGIVFGLPGNPASVLVTFHLFVRPALRRLAGHRDAFWHGALAGKLSAETPDGKGRDRFLPATLERHEGRWEVRPLLPTGSHDLVAYGRAEALVRVPAGSRRRGAGERCEFLPLTAG